MCNCYLHLLSAERISHLYSSRFEAARSAAVAKSSFDTCLGATAKLRPRSNAECSMPVRRRFDMLMTLLRVLWDCVFAVSGLEFELVSGAFASVFPCTCCGFCDMYC